MYHSAVFLFRTVFLDVTPGSTVGTGGCRRLHLKCDGTRAETRFRLSAKRTSPFKSAGASVQSTTGSQGVRISGSNAGYTMFRGSVKGTGYPSIRQFPLHFPSRASPCAIRFQLDSACRRWHLFPPQQWCLLHSIIATGTAIINSVFLSRYMPSAVWSYMYVRSYSSRILKLAGCFTARDFSEKYQSKIKRLLGQLQIIRSV